jgi:CheY-like chemotaxis protein
MRNVLIVEDDYDIRTSMSMMLKLDGYTVTTADNGLAALEILKNNPLPCIIILDLMMPVMSGIEFRERQLDSEVWAGIPVVVVSAAVSSEEKARELNVAAFLTKPIDYEKLCELIEQLC